MNIFQTILNAIKTIATTIWSYIFGDVQFSVLWNWLPSDIQAACAALIVILFILAIIRFMRSIWPF